MPDAPRRFTGYALDPRERAALLQRFPPAYAEVEADHVTYTVPAEGDAQAPPAARGCIVGLVDDGAGVQALVVAVNGTTRRPDGATFHITWSLAPGRRSRDSNAVIAECGWQPIAEPVPVALRPEVFERA